MSLVVKLSVNDGPTIGVVTAQRMSGGEDPDDVNSYDYDVWSRPNYDAPLTRVADGYVEHRYGDGALKLLRTILTATELPDLS